MILGGYTSVTSWKICEGTDPPICSPLASVPAIGQQIHSFTKQPELLLPLFEEHRYAVWPGGQARGWKQGARDLSRFGHWGTSGDCSDQMKDEAQGNGGRNKEAGGEAGREDSGHLRGIALWP